MSLGELYPGQSGQELAAIEQILDRQFQLIHTSPVRQNSRIGCTLGAAPNRFSASGSESEQLKSWFECRPVPRGDIVALPWRTRLGIALQLEIFGIESSGGDGVDLVVCGNSVRLCGGV
jgi:hypothetical protein